MKVSSRGLSAHKRNERSKGPIVVEGPEELLVGLGLLESLCLSVIVLRVSLGLLAKCPIVPQLIQMSLLWHSGLVLVVEVSPL